MNKILKHCTRGFGYRLSGPQDPPANEDERARRDAQQKSRRVYRPLQAAEIEHLRQNGNSADDWGSVLVSERFNPKLIENCHFHGLVRLGDQESLLLEFEGMKVPIGLYHSTIVSCDIGNNVAISHADYLAHYFLGDEVLIQSVGRMLTTPLARFGNGILKEGEEEESRPWLELANEGGNRHILAFAGILPADAWLWSKYRDQRELIERLKELTDAQFDRCGGQYGVIGDRTVIRHCRMIEDVACGSDACLDGAERLLDLTICSDARESTRIGSGVELAHGLVGYGCEVDSGARAFNFVLGTRAGLHLGARLRHVFLGDNSTVSCGEVLHSLLFPNHEQHHNNSFLIAATLQGQSNVAAGATIGSNHNSRAVDGEILAGRGFWPGLCTSFKHPCRFAAYTLIAKGDYPYELNIPLPFSLVSNDEHQGCLQLIPAYWFLYNTYAVVRNAWKFQARDRRVHQDQHLEFDYLAPDTIEEILLALELLESWTARAWTASQQLAAQSRTAQDLQTLGRDLLLNQPLVVAGLEILGESIENSTRKVRILKAAQAYAGYREMVHYYSIKTLVRFMEEQGLNKLAQLAGRLNFEGQRQRWGGPWVNLGGQLVLGDDLRQLKDKIIAKEFNSWQAVHEEYDRLWARYPQDKAGQALALLLAMNKLNARELTEERWREFLEQALAIQEKIARLTHASRAKDYTNPFRRITFENQEEMDAVLGTIEENSFVNLARREADSFKGRVHGLLERNPSRP